jgi:hypothetical protein
MAHEVMNDEQIEYNVDKENGGDALNIKIAGRNLFGDQVSPQNTENQKNQARPPMPGKYGQGSSNHSRR